MNSSSSTPSALDWPLPLAPPAGPPELDDLYARLSVEQKIASGAEHLLSLFDKDNKQADNEVLKRQVESELATANESIRELQAAIDGLKRSYSEESRARDASPVPSSAPSEMPFASTSALGLDVDTASSSQDTREWLAGSGASNGSSTTPLDVLGGKARGERTNDQAYKRHALMLLDLLHTIASQTTRYSSPKSTVDTKPLVMGPPSTPSSTRTAQRVRAASRNRSQASRSPNSAVESVESADDSQRKIEVMDNLVGILRRSVRVRYELTAEKVLTAVLPCLTEWAGLETRAAAWRLLRHSLVPADTELAESWRAHNVDLYLIRTLLRDRKSVMEKEQALKLIRAVLELNHKSGSSSASPRRIIGHGVVRALVAASEPTDEPMRNVYLETLTEMAIMDLPLLCSGGGLSAVLHALADGPLEIAPEIAGVLLFLADGPATRCLFRPSVDLEYALSTLTDMPVQDAPHQHAEALATSARVVSVMLRTWTGLIYLCMNRRRAIVSLITAMKVSGRDVQETILKQIIDIFDVGLGIERQKQRAQAKLQSDLPELEAVEGRECGCVMLRRLEYAALTFCSLLTLTGSFPSRAAREMSREQRERNRHRITLIDQYLSLLLVVFIESGIIDALVHILQTTTETIRSATLLMGTLLQFGNRVLPHNYNVMVNQLPDLFASASQFHKFESRGKAATALAAVDKASSTVRTQASATRSIGRPRGDSFAGGSTEDAPLRRPVDKVKIMQGINVDDNTFRNQLIETQILNTRDQTKWNVDIMMDLLQGPLLNARRLDEAMRGTKLLKRLLAFFHPFALRFSDLPATPPNRVYIRLANTLLNTLLTVPEGIKFLGEDRLFKEVRDAFDQIDPASAHPSSDPIFAKSRITSTLAQGYLEMIGTLSASNDGVKLLGRFGIWSALYRLCQQQTRDDIVRVMIEKLDYSLDSHPRILLAWVLTSASRPLRKSATDLLTRLIRRSPNPREWMVSLLLAQLCDPVPSIRDIAVTMVKDVCSWPRALEMVVSLRPTLDHLGETGHELLLRFLSTPGGVRYLLEGDYIDREMDEWLHERSHRYAVQMDVNLARALSIYRNKDDQDLEAEFDGTAPPHFYGELVKTPEGCEVLNQKGHFLEFAHFIRQHGMEGSDGEILAKLKSILWTVANIGATAGGFPFLEAHGTVDHIVDIAEHSPVLSVRGTCFYVIGLISTTRQGAELLHDRGWQSVCTTFGAPIGICLPVKLDNFVSLPAWDYEEASNAASAAVVASSSSSSSSPVAFRPPSSTLHRSILASISNLGNSILANKAAKTLSRLKQKHGAAFRDVSLFVRALEVLNGFKLRQTVRRFIWELFDVELDEGTVERIAARRRAMLVGASGRRPSGSGGGKNGAEVPRSATLPSMPYTPTATSPGGRQPTASPQPPLPAAYRRMSTTLPARSMRRNDARPNPIEDAAFADGVGEGDGEGEADEADESDGQGGANSEGDGDEDETASGTEYDDEVEEEEEEEEGDTSAGNGGLGLGLSLHGGGGDGGTMRHGDMRRRSASLAPLTGGKAGAAGATPSGRTVSGSMAAFPAHESLVVIDGFGEHRNSRLVEPVRYAPAPGVRIIGGFGAGPTSGGGVDGGELSTDTASLGAPRGGGGGGTMSEADDSRDSVVVA